MQNLSGEMYSQNKLVSTSQTSFYDDPGDIFYTDCGTTNPPEKNFKIGENVIVAKGQIPRDVHATASGNNKLSTFTITTPYGSASSTPVGNANYLIMGGSARTDVIDEDNILISSVGSGVGNASRIGDNNGDNPTPSLTSWDALQTPTNHEAIVRGGVLRHDTTDYSSTPWYPHGPNLSGRSADPQYFEVEIRRSDVSQFQISYTGTCAGCWVAMADNPTWTTSLSGTNGWADMFQAYRGSGVPTTAEPGCSSGGVMDNNGGTFTCVFGTESSSNDSENRILVRWKLTAGQEITQMSFS